MFNVTLGFSPNIEKQQFWQVIDKEPGPTEPFCQCEAHSRTELWSLIWAELDQLTNGTLIGLGAGNQLNSNYLKSTEQKTTAMSIISAASHDGRWSKWVRDFVNTTAFSFNQKKNKEQLWFNTLAKRPHTKWVSVRHVWQVIINQSRDETHRLLLLSVTEWSHDNTPVRQRFVKFIQALLFVTKDLDNRALIYTSPWVKVIILTTIF